MKLRINAKLRAALIAAISTVGLTLTQAQAADILSDAPFTNDGHGNYVQTGNWDNQSLQNLGDSYSNASLLNIGGYTTTLNVGGPMNLNQRYDAIIGSGSFTSVRSHGGTGNRHTVWVGTGTDGSGNNFTGTLVVKANNTANNVLLGLGTTDKMAVADFSQAKVQFERGILALASNDVKVKELVTSTDVQLRYTAGGVSNARGTTNATSFNDSNTNDKATASDHGKLTVGKLTMSGTTVGNYVDFILTGAGSTISGSTFGTGDTITVGEGADVTFSGAITLTSTIANSGAVTFSGATVTMNCKPADLVGTNNYSSGSDGYIVSANKYIVQGGTINGLTSVTIGGTAYNVNEVGAVEISNPDYSCYYLNSAGASVNVTNEKAEHSNLNNIVVRGANDVIQIGSDVSLSTITVADAASVSLSGSGTLAVTSELAIADGGSLTVDAGSALKLGVANAGELLKTVQGAGDIHIAADTLFAGSSTSTTPATTRATGALVVDEGKTLRIGTTDTGAYVHTYVNMESFNVIRLDGSTLWIHNDHFALNNLTVTEKGGIVTIHDTQGQDYNTMTLKGTTQLDGTLTFNGTWKQQFTIEALNGTGTLNLAGSNNDKQIVNIGGGTVGVLQIGKDNVVANITDNLTLGGLTGTSGTVNAAKDLTFTADSGEYSYTGTLTVAGQIVKQGAGTQTINGYTMHKGIDVQAGTLVLSGTYDISNLEMDPGVKYSYQDDKHQESTEAVGGFRATNGSMTVYNKADTATVTDNGTYMLDGKQVTLTDGKYNFTPEADLTTLWVNGGTLSYDAYYEASGEEEKALTTAKVAGGATLTVGTNAVGTLAYQTDGTTINLAGTGTVNAISGTGTLNLASGAVVTYNIPGGSANFTTTGEGTLKSAGFTLTGGTVTLGSDAALSSQVNLYSGKFIIGGDTDIDATLNLGESYGNTAEVTVNKGAKLTVNAISSAWGFRSITVNGVLNVEGELRLSTGNQHYTINGSGTVNTNKLTLANVGNYHIDGTDGLTLAVGEGGIAKGGNSFTVKNLTVQATADWTTAQNTALDGTLTVDTNSHNVTISSVLSNASGATGSITKKGAGTLTLSGANTYTGATMVEAGILKTTHLGSGDITVGDGATLDLTGASAITTTGNLTLGNNSTLVLAGENMLSVGSLALAEGTTALTLNLDNIVPTSAHTVVLATGTTVAPLNDVTVNVVWTTLPEYLAKGDVQVQDNSWVITLTSLGQELVWDGGEAVWSSEVQHWHAEGTPETHVGFNNGDKAIFGASETPAVANLTGAVSTQSMTVAAGANVTVQAAAESTGAALAPAILNIAGTLATSVNVTATAVEATGANAVWNITGGSVVADTITAAEGAVFALSISNGASLTVGNVTGGGSVSVAGSLNAGKVTIETGKTLSLGATGAIAIGTSATKGDATLNGAGTLALTGGTVTIHGTNKDSFTGNVDVQAGTLKLGESTGDKFVLGAYNYNTARTITVHTGATLDLNGQADGNYVYTLDGGRLTNTGNGIGDSNSQTVGLKLTADSYVGGDGSKEFWLRQRSAVSGSPTSIELNAYSLTKQGGSTFGLFNTAVTGTGSLVVEGGTVNFNGGTIASNVVLDGGSIAGTLNLAGDITITAKQDNTMGATVNVGTHTLTLATDEGKAISYSAKYEHGTAGTINAAGTVNYTQGLTVNAGTVNVAGIVSVNAHSLDLSNGSTSTGKVNVTSTGVLNVNSGMWMNTNAIDIAEGGTVNIAGLKIVGEENGATIASTEPNQQYGTGNDKYVITNAAVTGTSNINLGNKLVNSTLTTGAYTMTLNNAASTYDAVYVSEGGSLVVNADVNLAGVLHSSGAITVNADKSLTLTGGSSLFQTVANSGTVSLTGVTLGAGFQEQQEGSAYYGLDGVTPVEATDNHYEGTATTYVQVVNGGTSSGSDLVWNEKTYDLNEAGRIIVSQGSANYDTFYVTTQINSSTLIQSSHYEQLGTIVVTDWAELTLDEAVTGKVIEVQGGGFITGTQATPESVAIAAEASAIYNDDVTTENGVTFSSAIATVMTNTNEEGAPVQYSTSEKALAVTADTMTMNAEADVTVSNQLDVDVIMNETSHKLTLDNTKVLELKAMTIGADSTVEMLFDLDEGTQAEGTVTITEALVAGGGTLLANLTIADVNPEDGVTPLLNVNGGGDNALTLGSQFTIAEGTLVTLDAETIAALEGMQIGQSLDIIRALEETGLTYGEDGQAIYDGMWFGQLFERGTGVEGDYLVFATESAFGLTKVSNTPEPATGTLSLLALAALAARRRRH